MEDSEDKKAQKKFKEVKKQKNIEEGSEEEIDLALKKLKEEENNENEYNKERISSEVEKGKSVRVQKKIFD
jgi:hypothetical protein